MLQYQQYLQLLLMLQYQQHSFIFVDSVLFCSHAYLLVIYLILRVFCSGHCSGGILSALLHRQRSKKKTKTQKRGSIESKLIQRRLLKTLGRKSSWTSFLALREVKLELFYGLWWCIIGLECNRASISFRKSNRSVYVLLDFKN